jgi:hypothetical protein
MLLGFDGIDGGKRIHPACRKKDYVSAVAAGRLKTMDRTGEIRIDDVRRISAVPCQDGRFGRAFEHEVKALSQHQVFRSAYVAVDESDPSS